MPLKRTDVEALNAGPLSPEQIDIMDNMNYLLSHPKTSTLSDVHSNWQELKNTLPKNTTDIINDWEERRDELLRPVLDQLEEIIRDTDDEYAIQVFDEFRDASTSLASGENIPNITLSQYAALQQQSFSHLANYSDIYMNVLTNLSMEFANRTFDTRNVSNWFTELSAIGPKISSKLNETLFTMEEQLADFKDKLENVTAAIRRRAHDLWDKTKEAASNFRNNTIEWIHDEHPEVESTWGKVKSGFREFGNKVKSGWNSFLDLFRSKPEEITTTPSSIYDDSRFPAQ